VGLILCGGVTMQAGVSLARQVRAQHRHQLRTLTYVTLDHGNGGIVRNFSHAGVAVQAVTAVFPGEQLRVRFELRGPRLMVAVHGEVMWATPGGQCGIRFVDVSPRLARQINEWIFGNLLAGLPASEDSRFAAKSLALAEAQQGDGLMVSAAPVKVIQLPLRPEPAGEVRHDGSRGLYPPADLEWLSQPLSGRGLAWMVNALAVFGALLLFALVFLSVTREPPRHPVTLAGMAVFLVVGLYWGFFKVMAGGSPGARLARLLDSDAAAEEQDSRFR
jgi:hypothetical protein